MNDRRRVASATAGDRPDGPAQDEDGAARPAGRDTGRGGGRWAAAWSVEWKKFRRAPVVWIASLAAPVIVTGLAVAASLPSVAASPGNFGAKVRAMALPTGAEGSLLIGTQVESVLFLPVVGLVVAWCFGREFVEGTITGLFAQPVGRAGIAAAKFAVALAWALGLTALTALAVTLTGVAVDPGPRPWSVILAGALRLAVTGVLTVCATLPLAWVASRWRSYLPAVGVMLAFLIAGQLGAAVGLGGWIPWASPGLWAGMGGQEAAASIRPWHLAVPVIVGMLAALATCRWWQQAELGSR